MHDGAIVHVIDDDRDFCESIQWMLKKAGLDVEAYSDAPSFLARFDRGRRGCVLLDLQMPGMDGLELQQRLAAQGCRIPILILSAHADIPSAVQALKAGALDVVEKPCEPQDLLERIHRALEQDAAARREQSGLSRLRSLFDALTARERQVLELVITGKTTRSVARELGVSARTVEVHRAHIARKLQVDSVAELVRLTLEAGFCDARESARGFQG